VRTTRHLTLALIAVAALAGSVAGTGTANASSACTVLPAPHSLAVTLLRLHRTYMRHQPLVKNPTISGPVGAVNLGRCGHTRYALADFNARYNGINFGTQDQPERFSMAAGGAWKDLGNTGGDPCGTMPTALLKAWKVIRACPAG
jgi:hypothetical protein